MPKPKPFVGDIGTDIILDVGEDITGATVNISVTKPSGVVVTWDAVPYATGNTIKYVRHTTEAGDFDVPGVYRVQPQIATADGVWSGRGDYATFEVFA